MKNYIPHFRSGLIFAIALAVGAPLRAADPEVGFQSIFNGKDLTGWEGSPELWSVQDGAITGRTSRETPAKGNTFLIWKGGTVSNFELRCKFRLAPGDSAGFANSGIQYRSRVIDPSYWVVGGYQADMEAGPTYTGILYEERGRGILAQRGQMVDIEPDGKIRVLGTMGTSQEIQALIHNGGWNDYVIIARGNHLTHIINGRVTVDVTDDQPSKRAMSGILALQLHAGHPMEVQFKDMWLRTVEPLAASAKPQGRSVVRSWIRESSARLARAPEKSL